MTLKRWLKSSRNDVTRANAARERKKSFRRFDFSAFLCEQMLNKKRASDETIKQQLIEFSSTKQKTRPRMDNERI